MDGNNTNVITVV